MLNHVKAQWSADFTGDSNSLEYLRSLFEVNFFAYAELTGKLIPLLENGHGRIVVVSSVAGQALPELRFGS